MSTFAERLCEGCALEGKVIFIDNQLDSEYTMNSKKETNGSKVL